MTPSFLLLKNPRRGGTLGGVNAMRFCGPRIGTLAALLLSGLLPGCATPDNDRVAVSDTTINGEPVRLRLDTGAYTTILFTSGAARLGLATQPLPPEWRREAHEFQAAALTRGVEFSWRGTDYNFVLPVYDYSQARDWDGLLGWPEVRDNILVFDAAQSAVVGVGQLPAGVEGWTKLRLRPAPVLLLEVPLAEGGAGTVLVDTGAPFGIALPPRAWQDWRAANRDARSIKTPVYSLMSKEPTEVTMAWGEKVALGPFTLTDLTVADYNFELPPAAGPLLGVLGLEGISRLDLVVDGGNHVAYVRAKPPLERIYPWDARAKTYRVMDQVSHWAVRGAIRLNPVPLYLTAADLRFVEGDYPAALVLLDKAIAFNPGQADLYVKRAWVRLRQRRPEAAFQDFEKARSLDPALRTFMIASSTQIRGGRLTREITAFGGVDACIVFGTRATEQGKLDEAIRYFNLAFLFDQQSLIAHIKRGAARECQGDFQGALEDYDRAVQLQPPPDDPWRGAQVYAHVYRELIRRRLHQDTGNTLAQAAATWNPGWSQTVVRFLDGQMTEAEFLARPGRANAEYRAQLTCEAFYYAGMMRLLAGDRAAAEKLFAQCVATGSTQFLEYHLARYELVRLAAPPAPPTPGA